LALLLAWELYIDLFKVPQYLVPAPSLIGRTLVEEWPTIRRNVGRTLVEAVGGFLVGNGFAVLLAVVFVHSPGLQPGFYPVVLATRPVATPPPAPILALSLGSGSAPKIVLAALISFSPPLVNMPRGLEAVAPSALELMRVLSPNRRQIFFKLRLPSSLPFLF